MKKVAVLALIVAVVASGYLYYLRRSSGSSRRVRYYYAKSVNPPGIRPVFSEEMRSLPWESEDPYYMVTIRGNRILEHKYVSPHKRDETQTWVYEYGDDGIHAVHYDLKAPELSISGEYQVKKRNSRDLPTELRLTLHAESGEDRKLTKELRIICSYSESGRPDEARVIDASGKAIETVRLFYSLDGSVYDKEVSTPLNGKMQKMRWSELAKQLPLTPEQARICLQHGARYEFDTLGIDRLDPALRTHRRIACGPQRRTVAKA